MSTPRTTRPWVGTPCGALRTGKPRAGAGARPRRRSPTRRPSPPTADRVEDGMAMEERVGALLAPADPARDGAVEPPPLTAHDLIVRAEAASGPVGGFPPRRRVSRRALVT